MKNTHFLNFPTGIVLLSVFFVFFACKGNLDPAPVSPEGEKEKETVGFDHLSALSVELKGKLDIPEASLAKAEYGFQYGKGTEGEPLEVLAKDADEQFCFTLVLTGLEPATQYYFRSFCRLEGKESYSDRLTFTTKESSSLASPHSVSELTASATTLNGRLDEAFLYAYAATSLEYGFKWGKSDASPDRKIVCDKLTKNVFSASLSGLLPSTRYAFKTYLIVDGKEYEGGTNTFTTEAAVDLSAFSSANCYLISAAGGYKFKTVQGNSSVSVGNVSKAELLWESFGTSTAPSRGDIISGLFYSGDHITFATPSPLKNGNAVIAAKDADGNILWTWHIWVCDKYYPVNSAQTYSNGAGMMMDRNLGATSATPGEVGALGLLYQWGRKDPFLGGEGISSNTRAASTLSWPAAVVSTSGNGTIDYAVAHPTTFINYNVNNYDWYYTGTTSTDNTRWAGDKTVYDPCPSGWKVPAGGLDGVWSKATGVTSGPFSHTWDSTGKGMNFSAKFGTDNPIWYPAAGGLSAVDGSLSNVGRNGYWWSCTPDLRYASSLYLNDSGEVLPLEVNGRAGAISVRCVKE